MKDRFLVVEANAGSGKTFSLVSRYIQLLFLNVEPKTIFAITFARKATKEMMDRILNSLENPYESGEILKVAENLQIPYENIGEIAKEKFETLVNSKINISTIDSFGFTILKQFAHYLNIIPDFKVVSKINEKEFHSIFLEKLSKFPFQKNILTIEKYDESMNIEKILMELSILYQKEVETFNSREKILKLNISEEYLSDFQNEIMNLAKAIANWFDDIELSPAGKKALTFENFEELLFAGKTWLTKDKLSEYKTFGKAFKDKSEDYSIINETFSELKSRIVQYFEYRDNLILKNIFELFNLYVQEREKFIKHNRKFSFDDINHFLIKLIIDEKIDSQFIYFKIDSKIEHFLIDEFQDTSILQYKILETIIDDILSGGSNEDKTFFYVGDKMQSLYRFRGGFSELFDFVANRYENISKIQLKNNFRSKKRIVDFVNSIFGTNQEIGSEVQKGGAVILERLSNPISEVVNKVRELQNIGAKDIAIICSKNSEISEIFDLLQDANIQVQAESRKDIFHHPTAKAVVQYMFYLYYKNDEKSEFYIKNFQAILGENPKDTFNNFLHINILQFSPFEIGVKIVEYFKLFDGDENSLKFFDVLKQFSDISDFIHNYELNDEKIRKSESEGVYLLTIHKSKGLEFENVIFVDFKNSNYKNPKQSKILTKFQGLEVVDFGWNKNLEIGKYLEFQEMEKENFISDMKNKLYVALTRAKNSLTILQLSEKSSLEVLDNFMEWEFDDKITPIENSKDDFEMFEYYNSDEVFEFEEKFYGYQKELLELSSKNISLDDAVKFLHSTRFGTALHSTIEIMDKFTKQDLDVAIENTRNNFTALSDAHIQNIYNRIIMMIENYEFQNLIKNGKVEKEVGYFFNGRQYFIDLMITKPDKIIICDFKSTDNLEFKDDYEQQLMEYGNIISTLENKKFELIFIYPQQNATHIISISS